MLDNKWHDLPCGASLRVLNGEGLVVVLSNLMSATGMTPAPDDVVLMEASELLGHKVALKDTWICDISGMFRTAELKRKMVLDEPWGV